MTFPLIYYHIPGKTGLNFKMAHFLEKNRRYPATAGGISNTLWGLDDFYDVPTDLRRQVQNVLRLTNCSFRPWQMGAEFVRWEHLHLHGAYLSQYTRKIRKGRSQGQSRIFQAVRNNRYLLGYERIGLAKGDHDNSGPRYFWAAAITITASWATITSTIPFIKTLKILD